MAHRIGAQIIGVNNRNLVTFETDLHTSLELATNFEQEPVYISGVCYFRSNGPRMLAPYFNSILVGTALMKADNVAEKSKRSCRLTKVKFADCPLQKLSRPLLKLVRTTLVLSLHQASGRVTLEQARQLATGISKGVQKVGVLYHHKRERSGAGLPKLWDWI